MSNIRIEIYQNTDFDEMLSLIIDAFESKFCLRPKLDVSTVKDILSSIWIVPDQSLGYLHLVAKEEEKIVGVMLVKYGEQLKKHPQFSFFNLCLKYGFLNMLEFFLKLYILEAFTTKECYVEHIAVAESARGKGIGSLLLLEGEELLKKMHFKSLSLIVAKENPAKHLYERIGFKDINYLNSKSKKYFLGIGEWIFMRKEFF